MALPEPPNNIPRIVEVLDPSVNQHVVTVRIPPTIAANYPEKPWLTPIEDIGLARKDTDMFPGYVLVDIEPINGSGDLLWIFQKLNGPTWTTRTASRENLIPAKFRGALTQTKTKQDVTPSTDPTALTGDVVTSVVEEQDNTGKAVKIDVTESFNGTNASFSGGVAYVDREVGTAFESYEADETVEVDSGLLVVDSRVTPSGNGKSVKETVTVPSWSTHHGSQWDAELGIQRTFTEQYVAPPNSFTDANTSFAIVNKDRSLKRVMAVPTEALQNYTIAYPVRIDLDLPRVLKSVSAIWDLTYSIGTQDTQALDWSSGSSGSVSLSIPDRASSSASVNCDVVITYEDFATNNLFAENRVFYMEGPVTTEAILEKLSEIYAPIPPVPGGPEFVAPPGGTFTGVRLWPVFKPQSTTLLIMSQSVSVQANVAVSLHDSWSDGVSKSYGWTKTVSDDFNAGLNNRAIQIPPCIHPAVPITGGTAASQMVSATAWMNLQSTGGASVNATKTKTGLAKALIYPTTIPATSGPTAVPRSGRYLIDMQIAASEEYHNWFKVRAVVFDAANLS